MTRPPRRRPGASGATLLPHVRREAFEGGRSLGAAETAWEREFDAAGLPKRVLAAATTGVGAFGPRPAAWGRAPAYAFASTLRRSTTATALRSRPEKWLVGFACEVAHRQHGAGGSPLRTQWTAFEPHGDTLLAATATRFASAPAAGCASEAAGASEPGLELRAEFGYDARGNPTGAAVSGFRGHVPERRTSAGGFDRGRWPRRLANAAGHAEARTWDPRFGLPTSATDANGRTAAGAYDPFGRQVLRETADGAKTRTAYERCGGACGKPFGVAPAMRVVVESDVAPTTTRYLDRLGRTVRVEREALEAGRTIREDFAYDGLGRLAKATVPHFVRDGLGRPNADPPTAAYRHDARGRLVREARADGGATDHAYSARPEGGVEVAAAETILSPLGGRETRRRVDAYDAMGDHVLAVEAAGTAEETRTEYAYDGSGLLVSASVGGAAATKFEHDAAGNRVRVVDPHRGEARYEWTALGELRRRTDADGATSWAYDRLGRKVSRDGPDGFARWAYDAPNGAGMLAARCLYASAPRADCGGSPEFAERAVYGADARPSSAATAIRAGGEVREHVHRYAYDRFGRLSETAYPSGLETRREYNARGYRTGLWTGGTLLLETKATDARGSATLLAHLGGGETAREFDPASGRPTSASAKAADGSAPMRQTYAWRTDATLAWREDRGLLADGAAPLRREAFERDALGRLAAARTKTGDRERTLSYAYDALGSLLSRGDSAGGAMSTAGYGTGALGPNAARHATVDGVRRELEYDALGRVTAYRACASPAGRCERSNAEADLTVKWNARGLATEVAAGADRGGAREFLAYGPDGARRYRESEWTEKDGEGVEVRRKRRAYRVGAYEEILPDASSPWASVERTSLAGGSVLHVRATRRDGSVETAIRHLHADQAGSPAAATGAAGGALRRTAHDPYGARRSADWSGTLDEAGLEALLADEDLGGALGFGGHEQLDRVGLVDMAGRLYDPELGRFLGPDPYVADMASGQDWNAYAYVGGRPASRTDPTGRIRAGPMCNLPGVICMQGGDAGGASSAAPARGWAGLFGVRFSVEWVPTRGGSGVRASERPSLWGGARTVAWIPVVTWNVWALYYRAMAHGAAERQAADEPMIGRIDITKETNGNWHSFTIETAICHQSMPGCDDNYAKEIYEYIRRNDLPPLPRIPWDSDPGRKRLLPLFDPIRHDEYLDRLESVNSTLPGHIFHKGSAGAGVVLPSPATDGYMMARAKGEGTGGYAWFNNLVGVWLFKGVVEDVRDIFAHMERPPFVPPLIGPMY